jgi:hypothetical protein
MYLPSSSVSAYWAQVTGSGYDSNQGAYTFPCNSMLPDFILIIGGNKITVVSIMFPIELRRFADKRHSPAAT